MAERNQEHQHYMEKTAINKEAIEKRTGQWLGTFVTGMAFGICALDMFRGYPDVAKVVGSTTVISLAGIFIIGRFIKI
ncbi:hypothetical protein DSCO28_30280 [Desulfosarcina ovata subsp. sediminis]|uniref:Uncharacterized protein n=1 Tax=Desulfosarcina ovata subsp. sediminis TaxID=885957 RepID=A0A5K7ZJX3_9BACT|nr:hypothetical protein DSCO28_30280 [Desulfosarcina ovata subsp. sediminis]